MRSTPWTAFACGASARATTPGPQAASSPALVRWRPRQLDERLKCLPALLERRGGAFYSDAATAIVRSLATGDHGVHVVDIRNHGTLDGLAGDDVVEVPARVGRGGLAALPQAPLAPELLGLVQHVAAYERIAARAAITGDRVLARKALLAHPLIGQDEVAGELLDRLGAFAPEALR